jgi:hypothetical protein
MAVVARTSVVEIKFTFVHSGRNYHCLEVFASELPGGIQRVIGELSVPNSEYYLKQAKVAARLALTESDSVKATQLRLMALEQFDKAKRAESKKQPPSKLKVGEDGR